MNRFAFFSGLALICAGCITPTNPRTFDCVIRNGTIVDGSGSASFKGDIAIEDDTIAAIGDLAAHKGIVEIDASGLTVAPGFINMLSWADITLLEDGRSMSDLKQGVTLEVFGEGFSPGPVRNIKSQRSDSIWTTLGGYFRYLERKGMTPNVASFVGATSVRMHEMEFSDLPPTPSQLARMEALVRQAMEEGAMGLGSSLIYAPATYASTDELIALARVAASSGGMYITHMRSEGDFILPALNETLRIATAAGIATEIYHLKINMSRNWDKIDTLLAKIDSARDAGIPLTANMYPYTVSGTGLNARVPAWAQEGGAVGMRRRMRDPAIRKRVLYEMRNGIPSKNSPPEQVVLQHFRRDSLNRLYKGKTLKEAAAIHGKDPDETAIDLLVKDKSRIECLYFLQSEDIVRRVIRLPYVSFGSDGGSYTLSPGAKPKAEHPRAFGTFARVLGKYVREEKLITLEEAVRKMTSLPATNLKLVKRGALRQGYYADVVIFNAATIRDLATIENPQQYAEGVEHVFVNGVQVLKSGAHTGAMPGRIIYGPGYRQHVK